MPYTEHSAAYESQLHADSDAPLYLICLLFSFVIVIFFFSSGTNPPHRLPSFPGLLLTLRSISMICFVLKVFDVCCSVCLVTYTNSTHASQPVS